MILQDFNTIEELVCDDTFLSFYFQKNENDVLDWEDWQADNQEREALVKQAFLLIDRMSLKFDESQITEKLTDFQAFFKEKIREGIRNKVSSDYPPLHVVRSKSSFTMVWKIAAAVAFLIVATVVVFTKYTPKNASNRGAGISVITQYVENKSIAKVSVYELSDGSIVRLNTGSSMRLGKNFGVDSRDIYLDGEGYFEVAKNAAKPFHVYAGNSVTTAIGTAFTVRAYKGEPHVKILLMEGKVRVESMSENTPSVELMPKQQVLMYDTKVSPIENIQNIETASRWKDGYVMTFKATPFKDVVGALSEYYKMPITGFEKIPLAEANITAEFDKSSSLSSILEALAFANGFTFSIQNDTIKINK